MEGCLKIKLIYNLSTAHFLSAHWWRWIILWSIIIILYFLKIVPFIPSMTPPMPNYKIPCKFLPEKEHIII